MECSPFDPLFIRPQAGAWQLVQRVSSVTLGHQKFAAVPLASVVRCPRELFALRDQQGKFVSADGKGCVRSESTALPVRAWKLDGSIVLDAPCGPFDTAELGTFLSIGASGMTYVGSEFEYEALVTAGAVLPATALSFG
jgi:hypothetical protein